MFNYTGSGQKMKHSIIGSMDQHITSVEAMQSLGAEIAKLLSSGSVLELVGDVGAGKTTLVKGLARQLGVKEPIQSPTFTIQRSYQLTDDLELLHYDFYRLGEAGILADELVDAIDRDDSIVVIEWGEVVEGILPADRIRVTFEVISETARNVRLEGVTL